MCRKSFLAADEKTYQIEIDSAEEIFVYLNEEKMGSISLDMRDQNDNVYYYITNLSLEKCKRLGIGRACLQFHKELFDQPLCAATPYDQKMDDGSHLTGDGVPFIKKMRIESIVTPLQEK